MGEIKTHNLQETNYGCIENFQNKKPESSLTTKEANGYWDKIQEKFFQRNEVKDTGIPDKFYSTKEQRKIHLPTEGKWTEEPGNSKFISNDFETNKELAKWALDGIEYKNNVPDFSKCAVLSAKIDTMATDRNVNAREFYGKLCEKGYFDSKREAKEFKQNNKLEFHECSDTHTCQLVPEKIHQTFTHVGGRFECSIRDAKEGIGGPKFDE